MTKRILVAACLSTVVACLPKKESHSESKFSAATATLLDDYITTSMMREFCKKTPIFFYFGNAEGIVSITGEDGTMRAGSAETELEKEVKASAGHLRNMLRRMPHACESAFKANQAPYALLVTVVDGWSTGDSQIRATWYNFDSQRAKRAGESDLRARPNSSMAWDIYAESYWKLRDGKLVEVDKSEHHEISMPDAVQPIAEFFVNAKPPGFKGDFKFDQTIYLFKAHGGEFYDADEAVGYKDYYSAIRNGLQNPVGNAFLFDGHGPSSRAQTSDLYFPVVRATEGCAKFAAATSTSDPAPGRELCDACRSLLWNAKELGAFEHCAGYPKVSSGKSKTLGANSDSTLGANSDSTLGANSDSTLGANSGKNLGANSDSTLGANSEKDLGANSDSTLGANSDSTLGANSDSTLGTSGGDFLGFSGSGLTLGSGKSSIYTRRPSDEFEMIARLARAVVYAGDRQIEGTVRARLPMLGDVKTPPMVVLDSCHGTDQIANELFQVADPATPVVTVFNPNAMGLAALRYDALNYAHLLAFPWLQAAYHFDPRHGPDVEKAKRIFDEKMITEGLGSFEYFRTFTYDARKQEEAEKQRREACDEPKNREACEREDKQALENAKPQQLQVKVLRNGKEVGERSK